MPLAQVDSIFSSAAITLISWAHAIAPAGSIAFEALAWASLAIYLLFAVVAMHYATKPWAEKAMLASITTGAAASFILHLSLLSSPSYIGEGALWKFISLLQYIPWTIFSLGGMYMLYRLCSKLRTRHR